MKVTGFTFIRNAVKFDYPVKEAITSILPICDDFVVAVGNSDDTTLDLIKSIDPIKIRVIETVWDDSLREGGAVLAKETDKALAAISLESDWAFYIQGDEVVHEDFLPIIKAAMQTYKDVSKVDGLLFNYLHFYGSYDFVGASSNWYKNEIRIIKPGRDIYSYKDAQGFRKGDNKKLKVIPINACVYHYGWVKEPKLMQTKTANFEKFYNSDQWIKENMVGIEEFDYVAHIKEIKPFKGSHPEVMKSRIAAKNWKFNADISMNKTRLKDKIKRFLYASFGWDLSHTNYIILRRK